eukprot:4031039-Pleurochrysis_carterae.AAC.2
MKEEARSAAKREAWRRTADERGKVTKKPEAERAAWTRGKREWAGRKESQATRGFSTAPPLRWHPVVFPAQNQPKTWSTTITQEDLNLQQARSDASRLCAGASSRLESAANASLSDWPALISRVSVLSTFACAHATSCAKRRVRVRGHAGACACAYARIWTALSSPASTNAEMKGCGGGGGGARG